MTQMFSQQQEMVPFEKPVEVKGTHSRMHTPYEHSRLSPCLLCLPLLIAPVASNPVNKLKQAV